MSKIQQLESAGLIDGQSLTREQRDSIEQMLSEAELQAILAASQAIVADPRARSRSAKVAV